jgi:exopolysaccharide transport family protein
MSPRSSDFVSPPLVPADMAPAAAGSPRANPLDPREIARVLRRHARIVIAAPLVLVLLAAVFVATATPRYTATATVLVDPRRANVMGVTDQAVLRSSGTDDSTIESQVLLIEQPAALRRVVEKLDLTHDPEFSPPPGLLDPIRRLFASSDAEQKAARADAARQRSVELLHKHLRVVRQRTTFLVDINVSSIDPAKAAKIANAVADAYLDEQVRSKYDVTKIANDWLNRQIEQLKQRVIASDKAVEDFRAQNNLFVSQGVSLDDQQLTDLNGKLIEAQAAAAEAKAKYDQVREIAGKGGDPGAIADALSSEVVARLRMQDAELAKSYAELASRYGPQHPLVAAARAQRRDTRRLISEEIHRILESRRHAYEVAAAREAALKASLDRVQKTSTDAGEAQVKLRELQRQADANRALYEAFLARYRETSAQESLAMPESRVVATATPPLRPSFPRVPLTLGLALVIGIGLGGALALLADHLDRRIKTLEQAEAASGVPGIAAVPLVDLRELARKTKRGRGELANYDAKAARLLPPPLQPPLLRYAIEEPTSAFSEAVRAVRLAVQRAARLDNAKVVMITSAMDGEGKTTLAVNLALSLAVSGAKTILIEGDLRNPELTRSLCPNAEAGLIEAATGIARLDQVLLTEYASGLSILPCPRPQDTQALTEFVFSESTSALFAVLRQYYDIVVVDTPPIVPLVDGRALAEHADAIVLAAGWDQTQQNVLTQAVDLLAPVAARILGVVLTGVDLSRLRLYDQSGGSAYLPAYGYGSGEPARTAAE